MLKRVSLAAAILAATTTAHAGMLESVRQKGIVSCGDRGPNALSTNGGLMYAIPFR